MPTDAELPVLWPLGAYFAGVFVVVAGMVISSYLLGGRTQDRKNIQPYESGIASTGSARVRLSADFYLFAVFFVIFDLESVFVYSWAIAVEELGWPGYFSISIFILSLAAALVYLWRLGALDAKR